MLGTIWLIICAMVFGGIMDAIGALSRISSALLNWAQNTFQLFTSTVASCLAINLTASDQYLSIVVPGKMYSSIASQIKRDTRSCSYDLDCSLLSEMQYHSFYLQNDPCKRKHIFDDLPYVFESQI